MYPEEPFSTITISVGLPAQKLKVAAQLTLNEYKGITEQALREAKTELYSDSEFYASLKNAIKTQIKDIISASLGEQVKQAIRAVYSQNAEKMQKDLLNILSEEY